MIYTLLYIYVFYLGFFIYAGCQTAISNKAWAELLPVAPVLLVALVLDVLFNATFGSLLFWELDHTLTFSERLDLHYHDASWRGGMARSIGNVLDKILPGHIR